MSELVSRWGDAYMGLGQVLIDGAATKGRECPSWAAEYIRRCEEYGEDPIKTPQILLNLCECDRNYGVRLDKKTMQIEQQAYLRRRQQQERLQAA